jgi:hypothetical protein
MEAIQKSYTAYPQNLKRSVEALLSKTVQKTKQHSVKVDYTDEEACYSLLDVYRKPKLVKSDVLILLILDNFDHIPQVGSSTK